MRNQGLPQLALTPPPPGPAQAPRPTPPQPWAQADPAPTQPWALGPEPGFRPGWVQEFSRGRPGKDQAGTGPGQGWVPWSSWFAPQQKNTAARIYSMNPALMMPIIALFEFGAAFASVVRQWLWLVLRAARLPEGALNVFYAMCWMVKGCGKTDNTFWFMIWSGVLHGCPLSGTIFVLAIDPFLQAFDKSIVQLGKGEVGACADDVGASLATIISLVDLFGIFEIARCVAGLSLNTKTCVIVPLLCVFTDELRNSIRAWLHANLPQWAEFDISDAGKYLGA